MSTHNAKYIFTLENICRFPFASVQLLLAVALWMSGHRILALLPLHDVFLVTVKNLGCKMAVM